MRIYGDDRTSAEIHKRLKVERPANMDPPIHVLYLRSGGAYILIWCRIRSGCLSSTGVIPNTDLDVLQSQLFDLIQQSVAITCRIIKTPAAMIRSEAANLCRVYCLR